MKIDVLTIFPKMFNAVLSESIIKRAQASKKLIVRIHDIRDHARGKHKKVDDKPFGGGCGMVFTCQPVIDSISAAKKISPGARVILLSPQGIKLDNSLAQRLAKQKALILVAGHYEGLDERISNYVDEKVSIGDYILTGGELAAMVLIDAVIRFVPGVLGHSDSAGSDSFSEGFLEYPHYTRPADYNGIKVPQVLISGNHSQIKRWRRYKSVKATMEKRPDLIRHIKQLELSER